MILPRIVKLSKFEGSISRNISTNVCFYKKKKDITYEEKYNSTEEFLFGPILTEENKRMKDKIIQDVAPYNCWLSRSEIIEINKNNTSLELDGIDNVDKIPIIENNSYVNNPTIRNKWNFRKQRNFSNSQIRRITEQDIGDTDTSHYVINNTWKDAPNQIDINLINNFPLFNIKNNKNDYKNISNINSYFQSDEVINIEIFKGGYKKLPSVNKILNETMSDMNKLILEKWKSKMISELGKEGFEQYQKDLLDRGKLLHECIESKITGQEVDIDNLPTISKFWKSLKAVFPDIDNVKVIESQIIHPELYYQGVVDCVADYKGMPVVIEWKTSSKSKRKLSSTYDNPLQLVAYLGAMNFDHNYSHLNEVSECLLVIAYESGLPAHCHHLSTETCSHYWKLWCERLSKYWRMIRSQKDSEVLR